MSYRREGDRITLEMSIPDYQWLCVVLDRAGGELPAQPGDDRVCLAMSVDCYLQMLLALGYGTASFGWESAEFWRSMELVNRLNEGNPQFTPYKIPEEFVER